VYGNPGFMKDSEGLADLLADCRVLRKWAAERDITLDDSPDSLAPLDHALSQVSEGARRMLSMYCGLYLGTVIVRHRVGARWHVWPSGHPVVRLAPGRDLDVVAALENLGGPDQVNLSTLYRDAAR
jgi:hypothetical protein